MSATSGKLPVLLPAQFLIHSLGIIFVLIFSCSSNLALALSGNGCHMRDSLVIKKGHFDFLPLMIRAVVTN